jgi:uncharacterized radical SAM superfamily protein
MSQALIDELSKPEYASMSDQAAADAINAKTVTVRKPVDLWMVVEHSSRNGYRAKLELARTNGNHPCQETAINILEYINSQRIQTVDMDLPSTREMVQALVQCQFATQAMADELLALADQTVRWVDHVGIGTLGRGGVQNARKEINNAQ